MRLLWFSSYPGTRTSVLLAGLLESPRLQAGCRIEDLLMPHSTSLEYSHDALSPADAITPRIVQTVWNRVFSTPLSAISPGYDFATRLGIPDVIFFSRMKDVPGRRYATDQSEEMI